MNAVMGDPPSPHPLPPATHPLRRRRLARRHPMAAAVLLLVAVTLGARLWWGSHVARRLAAQVDAVRARGEPVDPADLMIEPLPDAENAWVLQARAAKLDAVNAPVHGNDDHPEYPPFNDRWDKAAHASEQANAQTFALARQARQRDRARVTARLASPMFTTLLPGLSDARHLANTLADGATYRHVTGDDVEAIERLLDVLHVARSVYQDVPFLVTHLVGTGINTLATHRAFVIAPGLRLEDARVRGRTVALIGVLSDERVVWDSFRRSFPGERVAGADYLRSQAAGTWAVRPLADGLTVRLYEARVVTAAAAALDNAEDARRALDRLPERQASGNRRHVLSTGFGEAAKIPRYSRWFEDPTPAFRRYFEQHFRGLAERRVAAASLALQLYRADHKRWPDRLDELVPAYLPAVPADPFYADHRPIGYIVRRGELPGGADRPLLYYDAGETDDVPVDPEPMYGWQIDPRDGKRRREIRQYRDVARWLPTERRFDVEERQRLEVERQEKEAERQQEEEMRREQEFIERLSRPPASGPATTSPTTRPATTRPAAANSSPSPEAVGDDP